MAAVKDWTLLDWITVVNFVLSLWVCFATYMDAWQMETCTRRWQKHHEMTNDAIQCLREAVLRLEKEIEWHEKRQDWANANLSSMREEVTKELGWWEYELEEHKKAFPSMSAAAEFDSDASTESFRQRRHRRRTSSTDSIDGRV